MNSKKIVQAYLNGEGGYKFLFSRYGVASSRYVRKWVTNYEHFGDKGLMRSRKNEIYSFEYKLHIVELYLTSKVSYEELALS